eukprot:COSAG04_NODE_723_length_10805_cov_38.343265_10_plen_154_part_00
MPTMAADLAARPMKISDEEMRDAQVTALRPPPSPPHLPTISPASFPAPPSEKSPAADTRLAADQCGVPRPLRPQAGRPERVPAGELLLAVDVPAREAQLREVPVQGVRAPRTACASLRETHRPVPSRRYIFRCKAMVEQQQAAAAAAAAAAES